MTCNRISKRLVLVAVLAMTGCLTSGLTGCDQWKKTAGIGDTFPHDALPAPVSAKPLSIVVAGQSNAGRFLDWNGKAGWEHTTNAKVAWISCGEGGTPTFNWMPNDPSAGSMIRCMEKVGTKVPDVVIWYQGEADAEVDGYQIGYEDRTYTILNYFRSKWPNVKIILCQIGAYDNDKWPAANWAEIQNDEQDMRLPNMIMVKTFDIAPGGPTTGGDGIHYTADGYVLLGERMARAYMDRWGR